MMPPLPILAAVVSLAAVLPAAADPAAAVRQRDDAFWQAYNACDTKTFRGFFATDVEFYHDRGGPTIGVDALDTALAKYPGIRKVLDDFYKKRAKHTVEAMIESLKKKK